MQRRLYKILEKRIYSYCDSHIGEKALFPFFVNLWPEIDSTITKKELADLTTKIIYKLKKKNVLEEIPKNFDNVYGMYKILKHDLLIPIEDIAKRKSKLLN